ncbi:MAG: tetratricopeptide repeat protein [Desulfobacterales bacterium]|nr:tetratricopeptide repeat protein [Desulfobacterales bacterium]MBF0397391.1 tetratricopeptide repeat protein [Desulfobacterales bacterium]
MIYSIIIIYSQTKDFDFIHYDDNQYIFENPVIRAGLTLDGTSWAFRSFYSANWHPVTWLSHMLDCQLFGLDAGKHHLVNIFFHILNTLLLFLVLSKATGKLWQSGIVAALFALHPLHVESVAWLSERKDVLSTLFLMLTILNYIFYVQTTRFYYFLLSLLSFIIGLLCKPMLVTLPFLLFLIDYWPLSRFSKFKFSIISEKIPFFIFSFISIIITLYAQKSGGAIRTIIDYPLDMRIANATVNYIKYLIKTIVPKDLVFFYPYPDLILGWQVFSAFFLLLIISLISIKFPYFFTGWFWYIGTLVPVIGIVQVGRQSMADRYTYVPLIGLFIVFVWGISDFFDKNTISYKKKYCITSIIFIFIIGILVKLSFLQTTYWKNTLTLFEHGLKLNPDSYVFHNFMGIALYSQNKTNEAQHYFRESLLIEPNNADANYNLCFSFFKEGDTQNALNHCYNAIQKDPNYFRAYFLAGSILEKQGNISYALTNYLKGLELKSDVSEVHYNVGRILFKNGKIDEAIKHYYKALSINPFYSEAHNNIGIALLNSGDFKEALFHLQKAVKIKPDNLMFKNNLSIALKRYKKI